MTLPPLYKNNQNNIATTCHNNFCCLQVVKMLFWLFDIAISEAACCALRKSILHKGLYRFVAGET